MKTGTSSLRIWWLVAGLLAATAFVTVALAEPGGKDDPLVTLKYAQQLAAFQLRKVAANQPLRLNSGAELVIVAPASKTVNAAGLTESTPLINLSSGERVVVSGLRANQHYVYGGDGQLSLRFDSAVTCLVRGEQQ